MNKDYLETIKKAGEASYEHSKELADMNAKVLEELGEQYMAIANLFVETGATQMKTLGKTKDYKEVVATQTEMVSELNGKLLGITRNTSDIITEYKDKCSDWCDKGVKEGASMVSA